MKTKSNMQKCHEASLRMAHGGEVKAATHEDIERHGLRGAIRKGQVKGPGGPTDDKISAKLSDGEYVLPADVVRKIGTENLDAMVAQMHQPSGKPSLRNGFAEGGYVSDDPWAGKRSGYIPPSQSRERIYPADMREPYAANEPIRNPNVQRGASSAEADALAAERAAQAKQFAEVKANPNLANPEFTAQASRGVFNDSAPFGTAGKVASGLRLAAGYAVAPGAISGAVDAYNTPTETMARRAGVDTPSSFAGDLGVRALGTLQDVGNAITFGAADRLGNLIAGNGFNRSPDYSAAKPAATASRVQPGAGVENPGGAQSTGLRVTNNAAGGSEMSPADVEAFNSQKRVGDAYNSMGITYDQQRDAPLITPAQNRGDVSLRNAFVRLGPNEGNGFIRGDENGRRSIYVAGDPKAAAAPTEDRIPVRGEDGSISYISRNPAPQPTLRGAQIPQPQYVPVTGGHNERMNAVRTNAQLQAAYIQAVQQAQAEASRAASASEGHATQRYGYDVSDLNNRRTVAEQARAHELQAQNQARVMANEDRRYKLDVEKFGAEQADRLRIGRESSSKALRERMAAQLPPIQGPDGKPMPDTTTAAAYATAVEAEMARRMDFLEGEAAKGNKKAASVLQSYQTRGVDALDPNDVMDIVASHHVKTVAAADAGGLRGGKNVVSNEPVGKLKLERNIFTPNMLVDPKSGLRVRESEVRRPGNILGFGGTLDTRADRLIEKDR